MNAAEHPSGLSAAELAFLPEARQRPRRRSDREPDYEIEIPVTFAGCRFDLALQVWGQYHRASKAPRQKDGPPLEPDEPAWYEVEAVKMGGVDVTDVLGEDAIRAIRFKCQEIVEESA